MTISKILTLFIVCSIVIASCKKKDEAPTEDAVNPEDAELYQAALVTTGSVWYKNSSTLLDKAPNSGHSDVKLKVRFNAKASEKLDTAGKVIAGSVFAENSLIVKELYDASGTLTRYAVMCKAPGSANADSYGWVWGVYSPSGTVEHAASNKGVGCTGCHSGIVGNIDLSTMNAAHP